jgi:DNA invertase Pin-like site-specific DNA recombinase
VSQLIDLYTRLSVLKDGSDSIERQETDLRAEADRQGKTVRKVWSDGKSGYKNVQRPDFDKAIAAVTDGSVPELWVWKLDRLSRQGAGKVGTILDDLTKMGGKLYFLKDALDSTVPNSRMLIILSSEQALAESRNTGLRVSAKNDYKLSQGLPVAGKRRFGYLGADPATGRLANVESHPEEAPLVQGLFHDYLAGMSIRSLSIRMGWRTGRVRETLSNPGYAGWVRRRDELYPAHESIDRLITQDEFDAVNARLALNPAPKGGGVVRHLASGIAVCGLCGKPMIFRNGYMCVHDLSHPWITEKLLDRKIREAVVEALTDPDFHVQADPAQQSAREAQREIDRIEGDIQDVLSGLQNGLKMSQLLPHLKPLQEAQAGLQRRLQALLAESLQARLMSEITASIKRHLGIYPEGQFPTPMPEGTIVRWEYNKLPLDQKRELIRGMFTITVYPGRGDGRVKVERKRTDVVV